ncbi:Protein OPY1 [Nakaseomyces bracarensis]|uniref:Protein OPY1 n=1 Tax=Nakaseomyces bracarensis TaxID=273131 RepID=A0ABR4NTM9_9SACH
MVDSQEVLVCSYLKKKATLSSTALSKKVESDEYGKSNGGSHGHLYSPHLRWPRHGDHVYWCVLRRGQFSYYKTKDEREAVNVLLRKEILNYRIHESDRSILIYTRDKTLRFKCEEELINKWEEGFKQFFIDKTLRVDTSKNSNENEPIDENDEFEDEDEEEDGELYLEFEHVTPTTPEEQQAVIEGKLSEEDKKFFNTYDPKKPEHIIMSDTLYTRIKTRFNRRKWKKFKVELTNRYVKLYSVKTNHLKNQLDLVNVVDCVEYESKDLDPVFSLISVNHRIKFKAMNEQKMIDWIVNIKSVILASKKLLKEN